MSVYLSQGFAKVSVNYLRNLAVVELSFENPNSRPAINLHGCIVGEEVRFSAMTIGRARGKFSKVHQMAYWYLETLI